MKKSYNVLVTGVGALIGYGIIESLKLANVNCYIVGTDIFEDNYGKYQCDHFIQVPYSSDPSYLEFVKKIIQEHKIDIVFPGIEQDLYFYECRRELFNTRIVLNQQFLIELSKDKFLMYQFLQRVGYKHLIPTYCNLNFQSAVEILELPFIVKPRSSYASKGFYKIMNKEEYLNIENEINSNTIFQPYVGSLDEEYTISVFGDGNGSYVDHITLRRYLSKAGASEKTFTIENESDLLAAVKDLVQIFNPEGPTNFQFRKAGAKIYLLEINPRISSACSIRTKLGYNEPLLCIQHYLEDKVYHLQPKLKGKAIRYLADHIVNE